jgi:torulene dioxygenase
MLKCATAVAVCTVAVESKPLPVFFRDVDTTKGFLEGGGPNGVELHKQSKWLSQDDVTHYRLIPGFFPEGMGYHFDGFATVVAISFANSTLSIKAKPLDTPAFNHWDQCTFEGSGTSHKGVRPCLKNPVVNLLPIDGQLWLTIDEKFWGRIDPQTLSTFKTAEVQEPFVTLNAHPACDPDTRECFVQHPCPGTSGIPLSSQVCVSKLVTGTGPSDLNMHTLTLANITASADLLLQHSHSPCITPNFIVSKLDSFEPKSPDQSKRDGNSTAGLLHDLHQKMDNKWIVMERHGDRQARVLNSDIAFVNNHAWNCFEDDATGDIVVDVVAATDEYLDSYFMRNLSKANPDWKRMFQPAQRCLIPARAAKDKSVDPVDAIKCSQLMRPMNQQQNNQQNNQQHQQQSGPEGVGGSLAGGDASSDLLFDYPTFNPLFKMHSNYNWWYAIAPSAEYASGRAEWFTRIVKVNAQTRTIAAEWAAPNVYVTEADFIPRQSTSGGGDEDDGVLLSILYNATSDTSSIGLFDAKTMAMTDHYQLEQVVPFHAHGISCKGLTCFSNP